jgi:solute carrier family 12 sodium/potassium/chloride transporter 2
MLLPHILTTRSNWAKSKLRVFCLADDNEEQLTKQKRCYPYLIKIKINIITILYVSL